MTRRTVTAGLALALALPLAAADWPRFRGPNGTGVADGPAPDPDEKNLLWKVALPGQGVGSPIVVGDKLFLQADTKDGAKRSLLCLDAADGKPVWSRDLPGKFVRVGKDGRHIKNSMASSTPASDGEQVYCVFWDGEAVSLHAYDLAGNPRWQQPLGAYKSEHGAAHSPAVYKGKVFVNLDQDGKATLFAFDAKTGSRAWGPVDRPAHRACYAVPYLYEPAGKPAELIVGSTTGVDSYDPDTGKVNWHYTLATKLRMIGTPVLASGLLVFYCGEGGDSRYGIALKPGGAGDVTGTAKAWEMKKSLPYVPSMLTKDGLLFWVHDNGLACCADAKTGEMFWEERLFGDKVTASPVLIGDRILVIAEKGEVAVLKAAKGYELLAKKRVPEGVFASPAISAGKLYVRGTGHLFCYGEKK
jgi:outer membrane protein assembly factor BamB